MPNKRHQNAASRLDSQHVARVCGERCNPFRIVHLNILLTLFLALFASASFACFAPPEGLSDSHELIFAERVGVSFVLFISALTFRFLSQKTRLWVPALLGLSFGYVPVVMYVLFMEGIAGPGGACGRPELLEMANVILIGTTVLALYECIYWFRRKRKNGL